MFTLKSTIRSITRTVGVGLLIIVLNFIVQLPSIFNLIRSFFSSYGALNETQYWFFDFSLNITIAAVITALALLLVHGRMLLTVVISIVVQLLWYFLFHSYFDSAESIGELLFRASGAIGIILGSSLPLFVVWRWLGRGSKDSKQGLGE
jgi:hypothetical protein